MSDDLFNTTDETGELDISTILGEQGKFKTPEDLAKAYTHAEKLINDLKATKESLEKEVMQSRTIDDLAALINKAPDNTGEHQSEQKGSVTQTVSDDDIMKGLDKVLETKLTAIEQKKVQDVNLKKVVSAVEAKFKNRANDEFDRMARDADMTRDELISLSKRSPALVLKLLSGATSPDISRGSGDVNTETVSNSSMKIDSKKDPVYMDLLKRGKFREATAHKENIK